MQDHRTWSWAFLGLLMISLHLPAFSARSISWTEETTLQDLGFDPLLSGYLSLAEPLGPSIPDHPWLKPDPLSDSSETIVPLGPDDSLVDYSWQLGNSRLQGSLPDKGASVQGPLPSDDTWQLMAHSYDDSMPDSPSHPIDALPSVASGSQTAATPPGSVSSSPDTLSLLKDTEPLPRSDPLGLRAEIPTRRSPWSRINRIRQKPLPGHPWGTQDINPAVSWGSQGLGTGRGGRPIRFPVGSWGISNQYPGTSLGNQNQYPGTSWGGNNKYPGTNWGINTRYPGTTWGVNNWYPSISWGGNNVYPGNRWGKYNQFPGNMWGINNRYPGALRLPNSSWNVPPRYQNHP
ncbi:uncharacterized protein C6orf15 homolog [Phascolarctos cinereus]|uniref:Uncharacterized protein C6orf15 homolog n=1 Tax=Phascolarctos cinereus TaxID=38626 RepID=A0A6P5J8I9_PHACI|nr:uncharacterized protein C6orf15 homolog [Phascolarctos cinereus]XP_020829703.1 uncharacterized protein C6orf15 homolog [Phascolarctos cinereus]